VLYLNTEVYIMGCCASYQLYYALQKQDNDIAYFSFAGVKTMAKVVNIYDGDTCSIVFKHKGHWIKYRTRGLGYDTSELHPRKNIDFREIEVANAQRQKAAFQDLLHYNNGIIDVELKGFDKYGRILAVYFGKDKSTSINDIMISSHGGKPYDGGHKV